MGTLVITRNLIDCDGCGTRFGGSEGFASAMEARAAAYAEGWRFPNHVSKNGGRKLQSTSDACPACHPNWQPRTPSSRIRNVSREELEAE